MVEVVKKEVEVSCTAARAFEVFVGKTSGWWPLDKHSVSAGAGKRAMNITIEPRVGGTVFEIKYDGEKTDWGKVLIYEAGTHLAMTWHPGTNGDSPTRVDVWFEDLPDGRAKVTLVHSGWEIWADEASDMREGYNNGWVFVFENCFATACGGKN